jgi:hypothetical protein
VPQWGQIRNSFRTGLPHPQQVAASVLPQFEQNRWLLGTSEPHPGHRCDSRSRHTRYAMSPIGTVNGWSAVQKAVGIPLFIVSK